MQAMNEAGPYLAVHTSGLQLHEPLVVQGKHLEWNERSDRSSSELLA